MVLLALLLLTAGASSVGKLLLALLILVINAPLPFPLFGAVGTLSTTDVAVVSTVLTVSLSLALFDRLPGDFVSILPR